MAVGVPLDRSDLLELHYITPIGNVGSIMECGILSWRLARPLRPASVAMEEVQSIRAGRRVPGGLALHDYANLYVHGRNPMLFKRRDQHMSICVLRVSTDVLDLPGVVIADGNAASQYTAFWPSPGGLRGLDSALVLAEYWTDENPVLRWRKARARCAEVLVPRLVEARFIIGAYASCPEAAGELAGAASGLGSDVAPAFFFRG